MIYINDIYPYVPYLPWAILGILLILQLYYILFVYRKLSRYKVESYQGKQQYPPLSVIICAHNEQDNLRAFLPSILEQEYPDFEVIVVDDCSNEDSSWVLKEFAARYPERLKIVEIKEHIRLKHTKKFALTIGIKAAKNELLLMSDADCEPQGKLWLQEMAGAFAEGKEIVLGYSPYFKMKGFLNKVIRFETTHTAMSYLAYALKKDSYMAVGRNLAYTKSLFFKSKGFNKHMHLKSGDDDLFVNHNATASNVAVAIHPEAQVFSNPKTTWKSYYKQKGRHAGASTLYKARHKRMLATQLISALLFYVALAVAVILQPHYWPFALGAYLLRLSCQLLVFRPIYKKLHVADLLVWLPLLDLFYYFYICVNGLFNRKKKQKSWK